MVKVTKPFLISVLMIKLILNSNGVVQHANSETKKKPDQLIQQEVEEFLEQQREVDSS